LVQGNSYFISHLLNKFHKISTTKEKADEERIIPLLPNPAITFKRPPRLMHPLSSTYIEKFSSYSEIP